MLISRSEKETAAYAEEMGKKMNRGLVCLFGDLGAGKTTFVRGFAKGLGVKSRIASPTFTYERVHSGRVKLYHFDCYRLKKASPFLAARIHEALERGDGVVVIEWAEKIRRYLPTERMNLYFEHTGGDTRTITSSHD